MCSFDTFVAEVRSTLWLPSFFMESPDWLEPISGSHRDAVAMLQHRSAIIGNALNMPPSYVSKLQEKFDGWFQSE